MKYIVRYMGYGSTPDERLNETRVVEASSVDEAIAEFNHDLGTKTNPGEWYRVAEVGPVVAEFRVP